jgi:predicted RNA-binding Zn ribbon-like protein
MPTPMRFVGGLPCLDFVNTVGGWSGDVAREDKLESYQGLVRWSHLAGLTSHAEGRSLARLGASRATRVLKRAITLRLAIYRLFKSAVEGMRPSVADLAVLNTELSLARKHQALVHSGGHFQWTWNNPDGALDSILWRVSQSAADLLTSPDVTRVRQCVGPDCGWLFLDSSRNHSRHWCDMKDCGNRAKVRRFRQRSARTPACRVHTCVNARRG